MVTDRTLWHAEDRGQICRARSALAKEEDDPGAETVGKSTELALIFDNKYVGEVVVRVTVDNYRLYEKARLLPSPPSRASGSGRPPGHQAYLPGCGSLQGSFAQRVAKVRVTRRFPTNSAMANEPSRSGTNEIG
jgi:hypothetical protein